jgi:hypothetical protein
MQIHELNQPRKSQVNEVEVSGPGGIFNVGKQVLKNPKALVSSPALGAAQQAAAQSSAAASAQKLAAQGYKVGASRKPPVTLAQQLQTVQQNPAVQQQVNNLTAQWQSQAGAVVTAARSRRTLPEAVVISNPETTKDPDERKLLDLYYRQQAAKGEVTGTTPETPAQPETPNSQDRAAVNSQLQDVASAFARWSDSKLATGGITMDQIRTRSEYKQVLNDQLTAIAVQSLANPNSPAATAAINTYFNTAIAAIQTEVNNRQSSTSTAGAQQSAAPVAADNDTEVLNTLQQQGIPVTRASLEKLGQLLAAANNGNYSVRNTGNRLLNSIARLAGMRITT